MDHLSSKSYRCFYCGFQKIVLRFCNTSVLCFIPLKLLHYKKKTHFYLNGRWKDIFVVIYPSRIIISCFLMRNKVLRF